MKKLIAAFCLWISSLSAFAQPASKGEAIPTSLRVSGTMVDSSTGQPLSRVRVAIALVGQRDAFTTVVTSGDGRFRFSPLTPGQYALTAQRRGYIMQSFNQHDQLSSSIAVGPDHESSDLLFQLTRESQISGTVTDEQGDAVRYAQVLLFQSSNTGGMLHTRQRTTATTDDEGYFHFAHLPSGKYFIAVSATPWYARRIASAQGVRTSSARSNNVLSVQGSIVSTPPPGPSASIPDEGSPSPLDVAYPLTFYPSATDYVAATPIILGKGERAVADLSLHPVPALHLYLSTGNIDSNGRVPPAFVQSVFMGSEVAIKTQSNDVAPGIVELSGFAPGSYIMKIYANDRGTESEDENEIDVTQSGVLDGSRHKILVPITVALQFETPRSIPKRGTIELRNKKSFQVYGEPVNEKGEIDFQKGIPPGRYEVSLRTSQEVFIKSMSASGAHVTGRTLEIKGSGAVKLSMLVTLGEGTVNGLALRDGKPFAGAMILLVPADPGNNQVLFRRDQSNTDGSFSLPYVVPGRYTLLAIADGWDMEWANPDELKKYMPRGTTVFVDRPQKYQINVNVQ